MASVPSTLFEIDSANVNRAGLAAHLRGIATRLFSKTNPATPIDRKTAADADFYDRFYG